MTLYSIGHSNVGFDFFLGLLKRFQIDTLVDARSKPWSRYNPHFSRDPLKLALTEQGIAYSYLGDKIGGKPEAGDFYFENGRVDYERLAGAAFYQEGLNRLMELGAERNVAFLCAEADYRHCHRHWLITRSLLDHGVEVRHILHTGEIAEADAKDFEQDQMTLFYRTAQMIAPSA